MITDDYYYNEIRQKSVGSSPTLTHWRILIILNVTCDLVTLTFDTLRVIHVMLYYVRVGHMFLSPSDSTGDSRLQRTCCSMTSRDI